MGLRDWIKSIIAKRFGTKQLSEGNDPQLTPSDPTFHSALDDLKVSGVDDLSKLSFTEIEEEYKATLKEISEKYRTTVLSDATLKKIKDDEIKTGKIGETPFICTVEMDSSGNFKTTVIVTDKSCSKVTEDKDGNVTYQETRIDGKETKTVVNTKDTSMVITGNVTQSEIDKIKNFSESNKEKITNLKNFGDDKTNAEYKKTLEELGVKKDINMKNSKDYMSSFSGRVIRDENGKLKKLEEMTLVLDRNNKESDPLIISFNTFEKDKTVERKFFLTKDGKYVDENSFKMENGKPVYSTVDMKYIKDLAKSNNLDPQFIDRAKKINRENVQLVPPVAKKLHDDMKNVDLAKEKEQREKKAKENAEGKDVAGESFEQSDFKISPGDTFREDIRPRKEEANEPPTQDDGETRE